MPKGICADRAYSYAGLERIAAYVRERLNFSPTEAINALKLFEGLDDITIRDGTGTAIPLRGHVADLEDSEGYARYDRERRVIEVVAAAQTYAWLEEEYPRAGYFVAHELGHCLLHTDQLVRLAQMPAVQQAALHRGGAFADHKVYRDTEWQANNFASALLMPAQGLAALEKRYQTICPTDISEHFRVSSEAAGYRLDLFQKRRNQLLSI
jgi:hypothetical protein